MLGCAVMLIMKWEGTNVTNALTTVQPYGDPNQWEMLQTPHFVVLVLLSKVFFFLFFFFSKVAHKCLRSTQTIQNIFSLLNYIELC